MGLFAKWLVAGLMVSAGALGVGGAAAQSLTDSSNAVGATGAGGAARPTAAQIIVRLLAKNKLRLAALDHYESERTYRVQYTGTGGEHRAQIEVRAEYSRPDQKRFTVVSESG